MIINKINNGLSETINTWLKYSNGEYIYFIDADDYLEEEGLFELSKYYIFWCCFFFGWNKCN